VSDARAYAGIVCECECEGVLHNVIILVSIVCVASRCMHWQHTGVCHSVLCTLGRGVQGHCSTTHMRVPYRPFPPELCNTRFMFKSAVHARVPLRPQLAMADYDEGYVARHVHGLPQEILGNLNWHTYSVQELSTQIRAIPREIDFLIWGDIGDDLYTVSPHHKQRAPKIHAM
jgi:hypothetical protein